MSIDQTVTLPNAIPSYAAVAVSPVDSNTWAVGYQSATGSLLANQIDIIDGTVVAPECVVSCEFHDIGPQSFWSADGSSLYIVDKNLYSAAVSASGIGNATLLQPGGAANSGFSEGGGLQLVGGLIYSRSGGVLDPATNTRVGQYSFPADVPYADLTVDAGNNRVFASYVTTESNAADETIESFNLSSFAPIWLARLPFAASVRWGDRRSCWNRIGSNAWHLGALSHQWRLCGTVGSI